MERFSENTAHPILAFVVPFSFPQDDVCEEDWLALSKNAAAPIYTSCDLISSQAPENERLRQFFIQDTDEYSHEYLTKHPYCRIAPEESPEIDGFDAKLTVSVRADGYGSAIIIAKSENTYSVEALLLKTREIISQLQSDDSAWLRSVLVRYVCDGMRIDSDELAIGTPYPFYDFYDEDGMIPTVQGFVNENHRELYGVLHQDVTGWRRTKEEITKSFLSEDLSRRNEYAFYISPVASVEIDDGERMASVSKWAAEQNVPVSFLQTKLILERILVIETLVTQKHLLLGIYDTVDQFIKQKKPKYKEILATEARITKDLCDFHMIRSQDENHVSGVEWREYGQKQFGLDKLYETLMTRISLIESISRESEAEDMSKKTYVISVFSFALSLSTIITIMDWFFTAPFIIPKDNIIWYITLTVLILTGAVILIWYKSDRPEKKKRKSRASKGKK